MARLLIVHQLQLHTWERLLHSHLQVRSWLFFAVPSQSAGSPPVLEWSWGYSLNNTKDVEICLGECFRSSLNSWNDFLPLVQYISFQWIIGVWLCSLLHLALLTLILDVAVVKLSIWCPVVRNCCPSHAWVLAPAVFGFRQELMSVNWINLARTLDFCHREDNSQEQDVEEEKQEKLQTCWTSWCMGLCDEMTVHGRCSSIHCHALCWHPEEFHRLEESSVFFLTTWKESAEKSAFLIEDGVQSGWMSALAFSKSSPNPRQYELSSANYNYSVLVFIPSGLPESVNFRFTGMQTICCFLAKVFLLVPFTLPVTPWPFWGHPVGTSGNNVPKECSFPLSHQCFIQFKMQFSRHTFFPVVSWNVS